MSLPKDSDEESIKLDKQMIRNNPDDAEVHFNLGYAYGKAGMYKEQT